MAGRLKRQANLGALSSRENAAIAAFGQRLAAVADEQNTVGAICEEIAVLLDAKVVLLISRGGRLSLAGFHPDQPDLGTIDLTAAEWAHDKGEPDLGKACSRNIVNFCKKNASFA